MAGANTAQCDMVIRLENEDHREYPAAYPSLPRVTIKEEPESEEDQDEREEESKHLVTYNPLPHNDIKEELEEESCTQVLAFEKESSGYQHSETEDLEENNVGRNKQLQGTNTSQEDKDSSDEDLVQSTSRQKVASKPLEEDYDQQMETAFDARVKVENTASTTIVDQESSGQREYPITYAPIPRGIVKEEHASEEDSDICELVAYMPLPHGDIKEEFEVENVDHDEFIFGVQVTGQMGGNQNPINEATDDAPPLVDDSTSGNEKETIGEPQAIKRKRTSKDNRSSETMPSSNHIIQTYGSSALKNADYGVKQFQDEKLATVECDTGAKGQKGTENDKQNEHSSSEKVDTSDGKDLIPTTGPSQSNKKAAGKPKTAKPNPIERQFKCINECGRSYKSKSALMNLHLKTNCGEGGPKFLCEQCGSKFKQRADLKRHVIRIHKIDPSKLVGFKKDPKVQLPFKCEKCQSSYKYKGSLNSHLKFDCGLDPTFSCTQCSYRAKKKGNLRQHLEQVHNVDRSQLDNFGTAALDVRPVLPFKCEMCKRTYKTKKYLKVHLKYDCGLDPSSFPCPKCKYQASRKCTLTSHLKNIHGAGGPSQS